MQPLRRNLPALENLIWFQIKNQAFSLLNDAAPFSQNNSLSACPPSAACELRPQFYHHRSSDLPLLSELPFQEPLDQVKKHHFCKSNMNLYNFKLKRQSLAQVTYSPDKSEISD